MKIRSRRFREVSIDDAKDSEDGEEQTISQQLQDWGPNPGQRYSQEELRGIGHAQQEFFRKETI